MLTFEEFQKLPQDEQNERYKELSDHDRFIARLNDYSSTGVISKPPEGGFTEEQKRKNEEFMDWAHAQADDADKE